jgi:putative Holliday junction resolvase
LFLRKNTVKFAKKYCKGRKKLRILLQLSIKYVTFAADFFFFFRIIAIDYGKKRVGIAATDELQIAANALDTLPPAEALAFLQRYAAAEKVDTIVVGNPLNLNGLPSEAATGAAEFTAQLRRLFPQIEVTTFDERFTSRMAQQAILAAGIKKMGRRDKALVDRVSACILLQSYMEYRKNENAKFNEIS